MARDLFPTVVHTLVVQQGRVLLLRRAGTGFADGLLQPPGGHVIAGESITEAAVRECREEACIEIARDALKPLCVMPYAAPAASPNGLPNGSSGGQGIDFLMLCERFTGSPSIGEPHRADHIGWFALDALPEAVVPFLVPALLCWREGRWFHEFGFPER